MFAGRCRAKHEKDSADGSLRAHRYIFYRHHMTLTATDGDVAHDFYKVKLSTQ